tara:strand:+ start:3014 stop:3559 length:546 start_codon:yes stop_codon:yes gene_type:complete
MSIEITVGDKAAPTPDASPVIATVKLQIRRSLNGDYYITDHSDIDIIILKEKQKILVIAKDLMSELVYGAQDRLFKFLVRKGLIVPESVQAGSIYGSMEGALHSSEEYDAVKMAIINISKYIDEERPYFEFVEKYEEMEAERFTDPDEEESTELGEVPHDETKGVLRPGYNYGPYWLSYSY